MFIRIHANRVGAAQFGNPLHANPERVGPGLDVLETGDALRVAQCLRGGTPPEEGHHRVLHRSAVRVLQLETDRSVSPGYRRVRVHAIGVGGAAALTPSIAWRSS